MSICINIVPQKGKEADYKRLLLELTAQGLRIVVNKWSEGFCEFYQHRISTRPIDITKEEDGYYEVRITSLAQHSDYELFAKIAEMVREQVDGTAYLEDLEDKIEPLKYFDEEEICRTMESDFSCLWALSNHIKEDDGNPSEIVLFGPITQFCVGKRLMDDLKISEKTPWEKGHKALIKRFLYSQYSRPEDIKRSTTRLMMKMEGEEKKKSLTFYRTNEFDMICKTDLVALILDDENIVLKYDDFMKIVPAEWERFDNSQYFTTPITPKEMKDMMKRAKAFAVR